MTPPQNSKPEQTKLLEQILIAISSQSSDYAELKKDVRQVFNAIYGENGTPGVLTELKALSIKFEAFSKSSEDCFEHRKQTALLRQSYDSHVLEDEKRNEKEDKERDKEPERFGTWAWFRDKIAMALVVTVLSVGVSVLVTFLMSRIFGG